MAAVNAALLSHLKAGDRVVASRALFGSCHWIVSTLLPKFGIETEFVDGADLAQWRAALAASRHSLCCWRPRPTRCWSWLTCRRWRSWRMRRARIVVVDNVFATPLLQQPLKLGADVVVYSCTKHIDGQGRVLGGAVLGQQEMDQRDAAAVHPQHRPGAVAVQRLGAAEGHRDAGLRVEAACRSAAAIADFLAAQPGSRVCGIRCAQIIRSARWPSAQMTGGGTIVTFEVAGGKDGALRRDEPFRLIARVEQSRRFQVARDPSRDDDPYAYRRGGACAGSASPTA